MIILYRRVTVQFHDNVQQLLNVDVTTLESHKQQLVTVLGNLQQTMIFRHGVVCQ